MGKGLRLFDFKNWLKLKHHKRLWGVGFVGALATTAFMFLLLRVEKVFVLQTYHLGRGWFLAIFFIIFLESALILFWALLSLPPKNRGIFLSTKGIYFFIRHPIYTTIIFHLNILTSLWFGSYILLISIPVQYLLWSRLVVAEEEYLISIFGQEYLDYMSHTPRFIPWG